MYRPAYEHDACGVGLVVNVGGGKSHEIVENGLQVLEEVCPLSARMVVNQVSMKMEDERIRKLITELRNVVK